MNKFDVYLTHAARVVLGGIFFVNGLNGFLAFMPQPEMGPEAGAFMGALAETGYFFPLLKAVELTAGVLLLARQFVPLALLLLAPIVVNITAFHLALAPGGLPIVVALWATGLYLAWEHRSTFAPLFRRKATPDGVLLGRQHNVGATDSTKRHAA